MFVDEAVVKHCFFVFDPLCLLLSQMFGVFYDGPPGSWRIELAQQRSLRKDSKGVYPKHVCSEHKVQRQNTANFGRHVKECLQRRADLCKACPQRDQSNLSAKKMAVQFD